MSPLRARCQRWLNGPRQAADRQAADRLLATALAEAAALADARTAPGTAWQPAPDVGPAPGTDGERRWLTGMAPAGLLEGVWLSRIALPATSHRPLTNRLLQLFTELVGLQSPADAPPLRYRARLVMAGITLPELRSPLFFADPALPEAGVALAALHLALSQYPMTRAAEIAGYTLAHLTREPASWDDPADSRLRQRHLADLRAEVAAADLDPARVAAGAALYVAAFSRLYQALAEPRETPAAAPSSRMAAIVAAKLPHAIGYHGRVRLAGRNLDDWLRSCPQETPALLAALRESPPGRGTCPAGSRLLRATAFGGPMFGVFDAGEQDAIRAWLAAPASGGEPQPAGPASVVDPVLPAGEPGPAAPASQPRKVRDIVRHLLRCESATEAQPVADACVARWLGWARRLAYLHRKGWPTSYATGVLGNFIAARHRAEVGRYRPLARVPAVDRAFCRWTLLQLAPAILVDGAWLAGSAGAAETLTASDRHLLQILVDELGEGRPDWHHPNVYRRLLESQGIALPELADPAFVDQPGCMNAAFDIPACLLAMGLAGERFRAERLGLNLAIELSGLGAGYLRAVDILRRHGMDPTIVRLHLSIDNPASGHTARARQAIELYLEDLRQHEGDAAVASAWARIGCGYRMFAVASLRLSAGILLRYALHRLGWRVAEPGGRAPGEPAQASSPAVASGRWHR